MLLGKLEELAALLNGVVGTRMEGTATLLLAPLVVGGGLEVTARLLGARPGIVTMSITGHIGLLDQASPSQSLALLLEREGSANSLGVHGGTEVVDASHDDMSSDEPAIFRILMGSRHGGDGGLEGGHGTTELWVTPLRIEHGTKLCPALEPSRERLKPVRKEAGVGFGTG